MESDIVPAVQSVSEERFLSTLSAWRATPTAQILKKRGLNISIHALRMESDWLSTEHGREQRISIHALRMESDFKTKAQLAAERKISIHALRMESDNDYWSRN